MKCHANEVNTVALDAWMYINLGREDAYKQGRVSGWAEYIQAQAMSKCYMMRGKRRRSGTRTTRAVRVEWIMICISYNNQEAC